MPEKSPIFRQKALERLSSPESLDQLMRIVPARDWLALAALGFLVVVASAWSVMGRLPTAVTGRGILIRPGRLVDFQAIASGRLEAFDISPGAVVRKGDVIGRIDQSEIRRRLEDDRALFRELQLQDRAKASLQQEQTTLQGQQTELQRKFIVLQQTSLSKTLRDAEAFVPTLKRRLDSLNELRKEGLLAGVSAELVQAEQAYLENDAKIADLRARLQELEGQSKQLDTQLAGQNREILETSTTRKNQIQDVLSRIALSEVALGKNTNIVSEYSGRVAEVVARLGKVVAVGERIATIEVDAPADTLVSVGYFSIGDGKKIKPGMSVQVTPDTVERQRYGGIVGKVTTVSNLPVTREAVMLALGNASVVEGLLTGGPYIEVTAHLEKDPSGPSEYKWSSSAGPSAQMSAGLTGIVRATVDERAPITYILPFLRSVSGIY